MSPLQFLAANEPRLMIAAHELERFACQGEGSDYLFCAFHAS
jgi:hypothetical protein